MKPKLNTYTDWPEYWDIENFFNYPQEETKYLPKQKRKT